MAGSSVMDTDTSEVATTSTETRCFRKTSKTSAKKPNCPSMDLDEITCA